MEDKHYLEMHKRTFPTLQDKNLSASELNLKEYEMQKEIMIEALGDRNVEVKKPSQRVHDTLEKALSLYTLYGIVKFTEFLDNEINLIEKEIKSIEDSREHFLF